MPRNEDGSKLVPLYMSVTLVGVDDRRGALDVGREAWVLQRFGVLLWSATRCWRCSHARRRGTRRSAARRARSCRGSGLCDCTALEEPLPTAISTITEATPIVMPRIVSPERSLLAVIPLHAIRSISGPITARASRAPRSNRARARTSGCARAAAGRARRACAGLRRSPVAEADHALALFGHVGLVRDQDHRASFFVEAREDRAAHPRSSASRGFRSARRRGSARGWSRSRARPRPAAAVRPRAPTADGRGGGPSRPSAAPARRACGARRRAAPA